MNGLMIGGIPFEFFLFAATLLGVAVFHNQTLLVGLCGLATILGYKLAITGFASGPGLAGLANHFLHEWVTLINLFGLLLGFTLLARHFEKSHLPVLLPRYLPHDWKGGFLLLVMVFVMSAFLDNIAAAMIGGAMAHQLFRAKVHVGYLAAIVAASNAGGAGSVVGDTTTTMIWISGVNPLDVIHAYSAAIPALIICGIPAALQQQRHSPILKHAHTHTRLDWGRLTIVAAMLLAAMAVNITVNSHYPQATGSFPWLAAAVWTTLLLSVPFRRPDWEALPEAATGSLFLLSLVTCASLMPVDHLPAATWHTTLGLGFVSAVFDNIPLTALAIKQGGYDWGVLAYAVGFGGSMVWFGSSAGVAIASQYPEARSVGRWLRHGWHVPLAYVVGFAVMISLVGWESHAPVARAAATTATVHLP